jgi:hypothetical protein
MVQPDTGVLLCLGCPAGITFGIDTQQWQRAWRARQVFFARGCASRG